MNKLALCGISGAGKDYLVKYLVDNYGFTRFSFSDQLKKIAVKIFDWLEPDYPPIIKEQPLNITIPETNEKITMTPREIWLTINNLRKIEDKLFIRHLAKEIEENKTDNIVISDVRTVNEFQWCRENNFTIIYIVPMKKIYKSNYFDKELQEFVLECDFMYENDFNGTDKWDKFLKNIL